MNADNPTPTVDPEADALNALTTILHDVGGVAREDISRDSRISEDLAVSSLNFIEAIVHVEDTFGVRIEDIDARDLHTVQDVLDFIAANRSQ